MPIGMLTGGRLRRGAAHILLAALFAGVLLLPSMAGAKDRAVFDEVRMEVDRDWYAISFRLAGAFTPEMMELVNIGKKLQFTYTVEFVKKRPMWAAKVVAERRWVVKMRYDSGPSQYDLVREIEDDRGEALDSTKSKAEKLEDAQAWMTKFEKFPVLPVSWVAARAPKEKDTKLFFQVRVTILEKEFLLFFPTDFTADSPRFPVPVPVPPAPAETAPAPAPEGGS